MRAVLDRDIIVHVTPHGDTEIGRIPPGVGLERLRFEGERLVDLAELSEIWVEPVPGGGHVLHAVEVPGSQLVTMRYADRKRLVTEGGVVRVLSAEEVESARAEQQSLMRKARVRAEIRSGVGDTQDILADLTKLVYALVLAQLGGDESCRRMLLDLLPAISATYGRDRAASDVPGTVARLRDVLQGYYQADQVGRDAEPEDPGS